jgi:hypothetical protein
MIKLFKQLGIRLCQRELEKAIKYAKEDTDNMAIFGASYLKTTKHQMYNLSESIAMTRYEMYKSFFKLDL